MRLTDLHMGDTYTAKNVRYHGDRERVKLLEIFRPAFKGPGHNSRKPKALMAKVKTDDDKEFAIQLTSIIGRAD